jgi:hypothetical protein
MPWNNCTGAYFLLINMFFHYLFDFLKDKDYFCRPIAKGVREF